MSIQDTIDTIYDTIDDTYNALENKGATMPNDKNIQNLPYTVSTITSSGANPLVAYDDNAMLNLLVSENNGKVVKFAGLNSQVYETNAYYVIEEDVL